MRYVYADGKIYDTWRTPFDVLTDDKSEDCKYLYSTDYYNYIGTDKVIWFDGFFNLIENGDLIRCDGQLMEVGDSDKRFSECTEIYKKYQNNFILVCIKKNGEWELV